MKFSDLLNHALLPFNPVFIIVSYLALFEKPAVISGESRHLRYCQSVISGIAGRSCLSNAGCFRFSPGHSILIRFVPVCLKKKARSSAGLKFFCSDMKDHLRDGKIDQQ